MKKTFTFAAALCIALGAQAQVVDFENVETFEGDLVLNEQNFQRNFYDEEEEEGLFMSGNFVFSNYSMEDWDFYCGFAISARTETTFATLVPDQFNSCVGHGVNGSKNYAVFYDAGAMMPAMPIETISSGQVVSGFYVANTAWVVDCILNGDGSNGAFETGDYLKLIITGKNDAPNSAKSIEVYLADYTSDNEADHYYLKDWTWVDLTELGNVNNITFSIDGSKKNDWGLSTPTYFCMDDFNGEAPSAAPAVATFEDVIDITNPVDGHMSVSTEDDDEREFFVSGDYAFNSGCMSDYDYWYWFGYASRTETKYETLDDQWNNVVGGGYDGSATYGVVYAAAFNGPCYADLLTDEPAVVPGFYITNSAYAYKSMTNGDGFAKKFEQGDWFLLTITGYDENNEVTGTKEYYLADLRDASTAYIINDWRYVDLSSLGKVKKLGFALDSSDGGDWGINTPAYFCIDNFGAEGVEELPRSNVTTGISNVQRSTLNAERSFDLGGRQLKDGAVRGLNIVRMADGSVRKVVVK